VQRKHPDAGVPRQRSPWETHTRRSGIGLCKLA